jgi:hypothetical protein
MSGLYAEARAEAKKMRDAQREAQKKADNAEREEEGGRPKDEKGL